MVFRNISVQWCDVFCTCCGIFCFGNYFLLFFRRGSGTPIFFWVPYVSFSNRHDIRQTTRLGSRHLLGAPLLWCQWNGQELLLVHREWAHPQALLVTFFTRNRWESAYHGEVFVGLMTNSSPWDRWP